MFIFSAVIAQLFDLDDPSQHFYSHPFHRRVRQRDRHSGGKFLLAQRAHHW